MKKVFSKPEVEVIKFGREDIMTSSGDDNSTEDNDNGEGLDPWA